MHQGDSRGKNRHKKHHKKWQGTTADFLSVSRDHELVQGLAVGNASAFELDALDTRIRELIVYARERDGEDRTLLFRNLVDLFLTGKAPRKQPTRDQLLDVIEALIPHVEPDGRRTVAELVANMSEPPLDLACRLAKDRAHLVGDLLQSTAFDEADIIELIQCTGRDHHHVIASRNDLSANVWIALARAAPVAPAFENQSSLALWRDDLGLNSIGAEEQTVTPFRDPSAAVEVSHAEEQTPSQNIAADTAATEPETPVQKGNVPTLVADEPKTSQLRILRTDKDLIADRIDAPELKMQTGAATSPPETDVSEEMTSPATVAPTLQAAAPSAAYLPASGPLRDPEGGGWCWRSDRDGLVVDISSMAFRIFAQDFTLIGASIFDLLGLNAKLGHPVSRAIQRRSTIHDAPLVLDKTDDLNRFWTLEATPIFSAHGGLFEGYDGVMNPVQPMGEHRLPLEPDTAPAQPLFKEEANQSPENTVEGLTGSDTLTDEKIDRTLIPPPETKTSVKPKQTQKPPATEKPSGRDLPGKDALMAIASDLIRDMVGETVTKAVEKELSKESARLSEPVPTPAPSELPDATDDEAAKEAFVELSDEVAATIHLLGQALTTLEASGEALGNSAMRLQTEIATACLKTLKEQLGKSGKH